MLTAKKVYLPIMLGLICMSFVWRFTGLGNHPFWVDEFSTVHQAHLLQQYGLRFFTQGDYFIEVSKFASTWLVWFAFRVFGESESAARVPFFVIGCVVPVMLFWYTRKFFSTAIACVAALLVATSYFMITWSLQARSYGLMQALTLGILGTYALSKNAKEHTRPLLYGVLFGLIGVGVFTHPLLLIPSFVIVLDHFLDKRNVRKLRPFFVVVALSLCVVTVISLTKALAILSGGAFVSNLKYYHSFLWREYPLITFLGVVGLALGYRQHPQYIRIVVLFIVFHCIAIVFVIGPYVTRYLLPIFPFLLLGCALSLSHLAKLLTAGRYQAALTCMLSLVLVLNGDKFVVKPKNYYSVNRDFREIALLDYAQVYEPVKTAQMRAGKPIALIDTWPDRSHWYLGDEVETIFFRWENEGLMKRTPFVRAPGGDKILPQRGNMLYISSEADLMKVMQKYAQGFIFIDDQSLPADVLAYAEKNLKKELYLERYPLDDNPYSIWPATLYSWGSEDK